MGQYIQEGERTLFETIISVAESKHTVKVESDAENLDGLNYLAGKRISQINHMAELGVRLAHIDGGVPNIRVEIPTIDAESLGALIYFFEKACGISGYLLGVNPFNQPGVEAYKKNMFALLDNNESVVTRQGNDALLFYFPVRKPLFTYPYIHVPATARGHIRCRPTDGSAVAV